MTWRATFHASLISSPGAPASGVAAAAAATPTGTAGSCPGRGTASTSSPAGQESGGELPSDVHIGSRNTSIIAVAAGCKQWNELLRGDLMASKSLTYFDKKNLNWGGLKKWKKLSSVICSFTQQGHFVMSSCPQVKSENVISSPPRVEKRVFKLLRFWNLNFPPKFSTFKPP